MSRVFLVRHGPTHAKGMIGWTDLPADLSDHDRIDRLHRWLPRGATLVSSDLTRAVTTADRLAESRSRLAHDPALRELHFGEWEGRHFSAFDPVEQAHLRKVLDGSGRTAPPGGEAWDAVETRVSRAIDGLVMRHPSLVVVAHMGVILTQIRRATGLSPRAAMAHRIDPLSVTEIAWTGRWQLRRVNHAP